MCVVGAGGVGGYLAARLAAVGCEVSVIARGPHLQAIQVSPPAPLRRTRAMRTTQQRSVPPAASLQRSHSEGGVEFRREMARGAESASAPVTQPLELKVWRAVGGRRTGFVWIASQGTWWWRFKPWTVRRRWGAR